MNRAAVSHRHFAGRNTPRAKQGKIIVLCHRLSENKRETSHTGLMLICHKNNKYKRTGHAGKTLETASQSFRAFLFIRKSTKPLIYPFKAAAPFCNPPELRQMLFRIFSAFWLFPNYIFLQILSIYVFAFRGVRILFAFTLLRGRKKLSKRFP